MPKQVVILGGGIAGVATAHKLLKYTVPKAKDLKVVLVSASSHLYWNIASVRGILPDEIPDDTLFEALEPGFARFPASQFEFVLGTATALDPTTKTVQIQPNNDAGADPTPRTIPYTHLVIATGSSTPPDLPFKPLATHAATTSRLHALRASIAAASSIAVAGAGPTGVEVAGELGARYGRSKRIVLVAAGEHALPGCSASVGRAAEAALEGLGVEVVRGARVVGAAAAEGEEKGKTTLTLSSGATVAVDLFLPTYGVRPNTSFAPAELLDGGGSVRVGPTLRVRGLDDVWALGDAADVEAKVANVVEPQVVHLAANLDAVLAGTGPGVAEYKPSGRLMIFVTVGKKKGTGQMGWFKVPGFLVAMVKGGNFFLPRLPDIVVGKSLLHSAI